MVSGVIGSVSGLCTGLVLIFEWHVEKNQQITSFEIYMVNSKVACFGRTKVQILTLMRVAGAVSGLTDGDASHDHPARAPGYASRAAYISRAEKLDILVPGDVAAAMLQLLQLTSSAAADRYTVVPSFLQLQCLIYY